MRQQLSLNPEPFFLLVFVSDIVPVGIIAGGTVGSSILLLMFLLALAFFLYRQRKGSECTQLLSNVCVCVCVGACTYSMCLSVFLSSTLHSCHSASPAVQRLIQMRLMNIHILWQTALKRPLYVFPFHSTDMEMQDYFLNKLYLYSPRTKYINNRAENKSIQR